MSSSISSLPVSSIFNPVLTTEQQSVGFILGRLFETLEQLQCQARDYKINSTIKSMQGKFPSNVRGSLSRLLAASVSHEVKVASSNRHNTYVIRKMELLTMLHDALSNPSLSHIFCPASTHLNHKCLLNHKRNNKHKDLQYKNNPTPMS